MPNDSTHVTWYRLEKASVVLSVLTQTNNQYITCCKAARDINLKLKGDDIAPMQSEVTDSKDYTIKDTLYGDIKIDLAGVSSSSHLITSKGSSLISGGISYEEGGKLFRSTFFHGKPESNCIINKTEATIALRIKVPVDRLLRIKGGDTTATSIGDVTCMGEAGKPGFIPMEWVDRVMWITNPQRSSPIPKEDSRWPDVRMFPDLQELKAGESFGDNPAYLVKALDRLQHVKWIKDYPNKEIINVGKILKESKMAQAKQISEEAQKAASKAAEVAKQERDKKAEKEEALKLLEDLAKQQQNTPDPEEVLKLDQAIREQKEVAEKAEETERQKQEEAENAEREIKTLEESELLN